MTTDGDIETAMSRPADPGARRPCAPNVLAEVGLADLYARFDSPIGPLVVAWNGLGVSAVEAAADDATFEANHVARTGRPTPPGRSGCPTVSAGPSPAGWTATAASGSTSTCAATPTFERDVWHKALEIPRGEVRPYGWIAAEIGRPKAVRAVGHRPRAQPGSADRALPSRRPDGRQDRPVLAGRAGEQADDPAPPRASIRTRMEAPRGPACATSARTRRTSCACRHATPRQRITAAHRVPFRSIARRAARRATARAGLPARIGGARRLTSPTGLTVTGRCRILRLSWTSPPMPTSATPMPPPAARADLGRDARPLHRLGLDLPRHRRSRSTRSRRSSWRRVRFLIAGLVLLAWSSLRERPWLVAPTRREWRDSAIVGGAAARRRDGARRVRRADDPVRDRRADDRADAGVGRDPRRRLSRRAAAAPARSSASPSGSSGVAILVGPRPRRGRGRSTGRARWPSRLADRVVDRFAVRLASGVAAASAPRGDRAPDAPRRPASSSRRRTVTGEARRSTSARSRRDSLARARCT